MKKILFAISLLFFSQLKAESENFIDVPSNSIEYSHDGLSILTGMEYTESKSLLILLGYIQSIECKDESSLCTDYPEIKSCDDNNKTCSMIYKNVNTDEFITIIISNTLPLLNEEKIDYVICAKTQSISTC